MIDLNPAQNLEPRPPAGCFPATTEPLSGRKPVLVLLVRLLWAAALVLPVFGVQAGVVLTTLHSFQFSPNGANPAAGLVQGSDGYFYGTTGGGGTNGGGGTVFTISTTGALTSLYSFTGGNDGGGPSGLVQGRNGNFYGTTSGGGTNGDYGTVFTISTRGALTSLYSFGKILDVHGNALDGWGPNGLVQGRDGNFYGTTAYGGTNNAGTVFKISTNGAFTSLYLFTGGNDGGEPFAGLVQGSDGYFYGTTYDGGTNEHGTVFQIRTNGVLTTLHLFTGGNDGGGPIAGLVQGSDDYFYGTTYAGGTNEHGTVFKISANGMLTSLYSFAGDFSTTGDGEYPDAGLVQGSDGYFYGTTGGRDEMFFDFGKVFQISTDGALNGFHSFYVGDGQYPRGGLLQGSDGNFYGTTYYGPGSFGLDFPNPGYGNVFQISTNRASTSLYSFTGTNDGAYPDAGLVQGSDGNFYGTTSGGGTNGGYGTVFKISTNGAFTSLYSFDGINGANPDARMVQGSDGYFYGTTESGGTFTNGTVFKISANGALTSLYSFIGGDDGANPHAAPVQGHDGNFYGTTSHTVFKITTSGALATLYSFTGGNDGSAPNGLVQGSDGNFYGTTQSGGAGGAGTVFRLTIMPEPPQLSIVPSATNVILTWPTNFTGFTLQSTMNLGPSAVWTTNSSAPFVVNGWNTVTNPIAGTQEFFRLSQ